MKQSVITQAPDLAAAGARRVLIACALAAALPAFMSAAVAADMTLTDSTPFRLVVDPAGQPQKIQVRGTNFENEGHPDRGQYMHWQIRRADGGWQRCSAAPGCRTTGWSHDLETFEIGGEFVKREGAVELRVFRGLGEPHITDPSQAARLDAGWSNVLRIPVASAAAAPVIQSLSKKTFPLAGGAGEYRFVIDATGLPGQGQVAVVFRGDTVVAPERIDDGRRIQVSVPDKYRRTSPGELSLTVRTDRGGESAPVYVRFQAPPQMTRAAADVLVGERAAPAGGGFVPRAAGVSAPRGFDPKQVPVAPGPAVEFLTPQGAKMRGEVRGQRLYLLDARGRPTPASDGVYRMATGTSILVQGGIIVQGGRTPAGGIGTGAPDRLGNPGLHAIGPKQNDPSRPGSRASTLGNEGPGGLRHPGGTKAIGPKQDDPGRPGSRAAAAGLQNDAAIPVPARTPGGIQAIGPKQDDPAAPGKGGVQHRSAGGAGKIGTPGGIQAIGPKQDDPAAPGKADAGAVAPIDVRGVRPVPRQ